ncbi:pyrokinin-1 receptor-like, partial [Homalodisca vitripennis]|uniref:pyrokinin-1 receptor-like n=1 Tax=Homalodisca vitripennis TaxID=197043 RepID=UPI001EEC228D
AVVVAFFVCWALFQVQRLYSVFGFAGDDTTHTAFLVHKVMTYASGIFYYLSTTINPILYNIMSLKFRQAFKRDLYYLFTTINPILYNIMSLKFRQAFKRDLYYLSTTINPILYNIMSLKFQQAFK